jgi:two-component system, LytTR family, response regulator
MEICIIDDEKDNRDILRFLIESYSADINISGEAASVSEAVKLVNERKPDLIFLDIELKDGIGFALIEKLTNHIPEIIFCTAYNQFAIRAIKCSALDYILKPVTKEAVHGALRKASDKISLNQKLLQYEILKEQLKQEVSIPDRFLISNAEGIHVIYYNKLICCIAESNYTTLYTEDNKIMVAKTLKEIEKLLEDHTEFIRIHQTYIINRFKMNGIIKDARGYSVLMTNNMELPVSRNKKDDFFLQINTI